MVTRGQLVGLGLGREAIARRVRSGRLHRLYAGVYSVGHRVLSQHGRWMAAVLSRGSEGGIEPRVRGGACGASGTTTAVRSTSPHPAERGREGRSEPTTSALPPDEVTVENAIPVTTVPRTIFDLAATSPDAVEPALRQAEFLRLHDRLSLPDYLDRYPRHRGARAIRAALARLEETPGRSRGDLEERFIGFLDRHGLPRPNLNVWLTVGCRPLPGRLPLAHPSPDRRARQLVRPRHPLRLPLRQNSRPQAPRRRLQNHPHHLDPTGRRSRCARRRPAAPARLRRGGTRSAGVSPSRPRSWRRLRACPPAACRGSSSPAGRRPGRCRPSC